MKKHQILTSMLPQPKNSCNRRKFIKQMGGVMLSSAALATGIIKPESLWATPIVPKEINIGTFGPSHCATPFVYAKLKDFFKKDGLNVKLINYPTMPQIAEDLINGKLDFGQLIVPLVFAIHAGAKPFSHSTPMVITQIAGTNGAALMVKKNLNISSPADFKGKTMANHSKLSVHYLINMMFLETNGLNYKEDVNFQVIDTEHILDAMKDGKVDTFVMPEPKNAVAEAKSIGDAYLLSKYIWPNHPCCSLASRRDFFDANQSLVRDVTRTITKSGLLVNQPETREETINLLQTIPDYQYDKVPKPALLKAFTPGRSDFYPFPFQSSALLIIEIMKKYNLLAATVDDRSLAREVFQSSLSRSIMAELGANPPDSDFRSEKILGKLKNYAS